MIECEIGDSFEQAGLCVELCGGSTKVRLLAKPRTRFPPVLDVLSVMLERPAEHVPRVDLARGALEANERLDRC